MSIPNEVVLLLGCVDEILMSSTLNLGILLGCVPVKYRLIYVHLVSGQKSFYLDYQKTETQTYL